MKGDHQKAARPKSSLALTVAGLRTHSPFPHMAGTWAFARVSEAERATVLAATRMDTLRESPIAWLPVAPIDTPTADVYMDITASISTDHADGTGDLPLLVATMPEQHARQYVVDFGREVIGWVTLDIEAAAGTIYVLVRAHGWRFAGTPWMHTIACLLHAQHNRMPEALQSIRERWGDMIDKGATTAWETFSGFMPNGQWTRSWCHAWSALPAYLLQAFVLSVQLLEPGFRRAFIHPQLCDLDWAEGRVPTPHGVIAVRVERNAMGCNLRYTYQKKLTPPSSYRTV